MGQGRRNSFQGWGLLLVIGLTGCAGCGSGGAHQEFDSREGQPISPEETLDTVKSWEAMRHDLARLGWPMGPLQDGDFIEDIPEGKIYGPFQEDFLRHPNPLILSRLGLGLSYRATHGEIFPDTWRLEAQVEWELTAGGWMGVGAYGGWGKGEGTLDGLPLEILFDIGMTLRYRGYFGSRSGGLYWVFAGDGGILGTRVDDGRQYNNGSVSLRSGLGWEFAAGQETRMGLMGFLAGRWVYEDHEWGDLQPGLGKPAWEAGIVFKIFFPPRLTDNPSM